MYKRRGTATAHDGEVVANSANDMRGSNDGPACLISRPRGSSGDWLVEENKRDGQRRRARKEELAVPLQSCFF